MHVAGEGCRSIRCLRCASGFHLVIDIRHFDFVMVVVAVGLDGVLTTILDLVVFLSLSRDGPPVAPGILLVGLRVHVLLQWV